MLHSYAIHYSPLIQRRRSIDLLANQLNTNITVITESCVDADLVSSMFKQFTQQLLLHQVTFISDLLHLHYKWLISYSGNFNWKKEYLSEISSSEFPRHYYDQAIQAFSLKNVTLSCQHLRAAKLFLENGSEDDLCLIIEDDSILTASSDLFKLIGNLFDFVDNTIPFFLDVSNSLNLSTLYSNKVTSDPSNCVFEVLCGQTRCASAYILNHSAASLLSSNIIPPLLPIDWHYSYLLRRFGIATYWSESSLFLQGSEQGLFSSNSSARSRHV